MHRISAVLVVLVLLAGAACQPAPPPADRIIGDSNTINNSWAKQLGPNCRPDVWAWGGVGVFWGSTYFASGTHLDRDYISMMGGPVGDHVVVMLGTNDTIATTKVATTAELDALAGRMVDAGAGSVRWATIPPLASTLPTPARVRREAWNQSILGTPNAIDLRSALTDPLASNMRTDDRHLNTAGHAALARTAATTSICD